MDGGRLRDVPNASWRTPGFEQTDLHPVVCVSWDDAAAFCDWAGLSLPTEAQWEKASRGTDGRNYPWGNEAPTCERTVMKEGGDGCAQDATWPVGSKPMGVSPYGVMDMAGNVWEWVLDCYDKNFYRSPESRKNDPCNDCHPDSSCKRRVVRGGSWLNDAASFFRAAYRSRNSPAGLFVNYGFRCCAKAE